MISFNGLHGASQPEKIDTDKPVIFMVGIDWYDLKERYST
jgi:hypothetical protein